MNRTKSHNFFCADNRVRTYTKTLEESYAIQLHHICKYDKNLFYTSHNQLSYGGVLKTTLQR